MMMVSRWRQSERGPHQLLPPPPYNEDPTTIGSAELRASIRRPRVDEFERRAARSLLFTVGRLVAFIGRKIVRSEPMDWHKRQLGAKELTQTNLPPEATYPFWSRINQVLVAVSMLHVAFNMYHQYKLDFNLFRMNHLLRAHHHHGESSNFTLSTIEELQAIVGHHHRLLTVSGAPRTNLGFAMEVVYWIQILVPTIAYVLPQFYIPSIRDCNVNAASVLINYEHHLVVCQLHIQEQVSKFLASSHNFQAILAAKLARVRSPAVAGGDHIFDRRGANNDMASDHGTASPLAIRRMMTSSLDLERELACMAASETLMPANSSPEQIFVWMPRLIVFIIVCIVYGITFDIYFVYILFYCPKLSAPTAPPRGGSAEWRPEQVNYSAAFTALTSLESLILMMQINCSSIYQGCTLLGTVLDMKRSANQLRARIEKFVRDNDQRLCQVDAGRKRHKAAGTGPTAIAVRQANVQLLELFMHYRVFVSQFKAQRRYYSNFMWTCVAITMIVPLISRLHVPYFDTNQEAKTFFIVLSLFIVTPATICLVPPCNLHRRCQDLTKSLLYLCAHIIRVDQQQRLQQLAISGGNSNHRHRPRPLPLYDEHLISALRREVGLNCCELRDQFTIRIGMTSLSYTTLLEFYFWFSLVIVSIVARSSLSNLDIGSGGSADQMRRSLGGLFNDPFGVYG